MRGKSKALDSPRKLSPKFAQIIQRKGRLKDSDLLLHQNLDLPELTGGGGLAKDLFQKLCARKRLISFCSYTHCRQVRSGAKPHVLCNKPSVFIEDQFRIIATMGALIRRESRS